MAVYKVIQDIEAEDKLLGPLTLKGFIYFVIAGFLAFLNVRISIGGTGGGYRFIAVFILFWPMLLFGVLASPLGGEQPTEVWLLSHVRFFLKSKIRIWNQLGQAQLVTITAPPKIDQHLTKDLSDTEVHSRLETLALTMDSRGWAIKNAYPNSAQASPPPFTYLNAGQNQSDRLVKRDYPSASPISDVHPSEDVLDLENSPRAQHVENLLQQKSIQLKEQRLAGLDAVKRQSNSAVPDDSVPTAKPASGPPAQTSATASATTPAPANSKFSDLAKADSLKVATIAQLVKEPQGPHITKIAPGEVEISLH